MTAVHESTTITSAEELRELLGSPMRRALDKERVSLHAHDLNWLAHSPLCLVATSDAEGNCDVSPKGDPPGFVHVIDDTTIAVPERPGNRRTDGFLNILDNPHVGLIFLVPGRRETLRINGRATLVRDAPFFDTMIVKGHRPPLAMIVDIEQIFFHCAKALMRSRLWRTETWDPDAIPPHAHIVNDVQKTKENLEELVEYYSEDVYSKKLYKS